MSKWDKLLNSIRHLSYNQQNTTILYRSGMNAKRPNTSHN